MMFAEIVVATADSDCDAMTEVVVDDVTKKLVKSFLATIEEFEKKGTSTTEAYIESVGSSVRVWHDDPFEPMTEGSRLRLGRLTDGRWVVISWICDDA